MFKKIVMLVCSSVLILALAGCGTKASEESKIELPDYSKVEVTVEPVKVITDVEVDAYIDEALSYFATKEDVTDRPVAEGDTVNIDFVGKIDGVAFDGGSSAEGGYDLVIGSNRFIDGFEDGLIGANVGDNLDLNLTFPEVYTNNPDMAGKDVVFNVTVNSIKELVTPILDDEMIAKLDSEATNEEELRANAKVILEKQAEENYKNSISKEVMGYIIANTEVESLDQKVVEKYEGEYIKEIKSYAGTYEIALEDFVELNGMTMEQVNENAKKAGEQMALEVAVFEALAEKEGIEVDAEEMLEYAEANYMYAGYSSAEELLATVEEDELKLFISIEKAYAKIYDYAIVTETIAD